MKERRYLGKLQFDVRLCHSKDYQVGDSAQGVCDPCWEIVNTTVQMGEIEWQGKKHNCLHTVCNKCGAIVQICPKELLKIRAGAK